MQCFLIYKVRHGFCQGSWLAFIGVTVFSLRSNADSCPSENPSPSPEALLPFPPSARHENHTYSPGRIPFLNCGFRNWFLLGQLCCFAQHVFMFSVSGSKKKKKDCIFPQLSPSHAGSIVKVNQVPRKSAPHLVEKGNVQYPHVFLRQGRHTWHMVWAHYARWCLRPE